jgi:hypothetical protein
MPLIIVFTYSRKAVSRPRPQTVYLKYGYVQIWIINHVIIYSNFMGQDSAVGMATHKGLDGPGIKSQRGQDFLHPSRPALVPTQPPTQWVSGLSRG